MATTSTSRLQLLKPTPGTGENVSVAAHLNDNWDKVDLLGKNAIGLVAAPVKRNTTDAVTSGTNSMFETLTGVFKAGRWYRVVWGFRASTSLAGSTTPNSTANVHLKAGGTVAVADPVIADANVWNQNNTNPRTTIDHIFDVPTDGTYTLGCSANSGGGTNTLTILASGGTDNTGKARILYVEDKGEKP